MDEKEASIKTAERAKKVLEAFLAGKKIYVKNAYDDLKFVKYPIWDFKENDYVIEDEITVVWVYVYRSDSNTMHIGKHEASIHDDTRKIEEEISQKEYFVRWIMKEVAI